MKAQLRILSGARAGQVDAFQKAYIALGRHPLADVRFDADLDLDVSAQHAALIRQGNTFVVRDLGSTNGTFVNSRRISGDVSLEDGDVIRLGARGPSLEFHALDVHRADEVSTAVQESARRASAPRDQFRALTPPPRSATDARIAAVVAHQTRGLRRATKLLIALLIATGGAFAWIQWHGSQDARELASLQARADSLSRAARDLATRLAEQHAGAVLLGVQGVSVVGHGNATARAVASCVALAARSVREDLVPRTARLIGELDRRWRRNPR